MMSLFSGQLDAAVVYSPEVRRGFPVHRLFEDRLVLISTEKGRSVDAIENYFLMDWGPTFAADHLARFPDSSAGGLFFRLGTLCFEYILLHGGCGYFPLRKVQPYLEEGRIFAVRDAPEFRSMVHLVSTSDVSESSDLVWLNTLKRQLEKYAEKQLIIPVDKRANGSV